MFREANSESPIPPLNRKKIELTLFMTRGMSLRRWDRLGMFEREVALYRELRPKLKKISLVTYGGKDDLEYAGQLPGIDILCNEWNLPFSVYGRLIPFLHSKTLRKADIFKTNQTNGADVALRAARSFNKPLIARCGYMWSDFVARGSEREYRLEKVIEIERRVFSGAAQVVVTTSSMKDEVEKNYSVSPDRIVVIPNYVRTDLLVPKPSMRRKDVICFIGRLEPQKNPVALIDALEGLKIRLHVIGQGPLRSEMERRAARLNVEVKFENTVRHEQIGDFLNQGSIFVLPSHYEGHPKTLLEAMSCGLAVIGANSPGIREIIRHGETGYLCGTESSSIRDAIITLLKDKMLCESMERNARDYAVRHFALDKIAGKELSTLEEVFDRQASRRVC